MREAIGARTLWAMHPVALTELLQREAVAGIVPEVLQSLFGAASSAAAAKPADPIREGATMIVPVEGILSPKGSYGGMSTERFVNVVDDASRDDRVGAIVIKIMSPGGLVFGTQEAGDAVFAARQIKPVIAIADKYAFSAAHWIGTQATAYFATSSGEVGSAGARGGHVDMSGFEQKIGMVTTLIASDPKKIAAHPYAPLSDEDRAELQAEIDDANASFVAAIARGRGIKAGDVPVIHGTGQTFSARRAAELGITDGVMTLRDVMAKYGSSRARLDLMRKRAALQTQTIDI